MTKAFVTALLIAGATAVGGTFAVYCLALFYSNPPIPANGIEKSREPQGYSEGTQPDTNYYQRGTPDIPIFIHVLPTKKTNAEAAQDEAERFKKSLNDWGMLGFTGLSAFIFLAQLFVFGRQARRLKETVGAMREIDEGQTSRMANSIAEAARAATAMEGVATEAAHQRVAAENQLKLIGMQTDLLEKQKEIARQAFIATHRPRLSVRNIVLKPSARDWAGQQDMIIGDLPEGQLYVVNRGGSNAFITDGLIMVHTDEKSNLPMARPYGGKNGNIGSMRFPILAGTSIPILFASDSRIEEGSRIRMLRGDGGSLYVMGWIEYSDGAYEISTGTQITRRTAFCRKFASTTQRFVRVQDEDYEHEE
jgi:hypothetical protein